MQERRIEMKALQGKVALVTGSSRGIGAAIARVFAREGAHVALHGRDEAALLAVRAEVEREGGRVTHVRADLTRYAEIEAMRERIERDLGPIEILVANSGGSYVKPGPLEETSEEGWRVAGIIGLQGRAEEWARRLHGNVPEDMVPNGPLTPYGAVRMQLTGETGSVKPVRPVTGGTTTISGRAKSAAPKAAKKSSKVKSK